MSFRLVPNSVTCDDLERRNSRNRRVISPNSVAFGADYVKVIEDTPILHHFLDIAFEVQNRYIWVPLLCLTPPTEGFPWDNFRKIFNERSSMAKVPNGVETLPKISIV